MKSSSSREPLRVLVLCTANSARSQMAEGLLRQLSGGRVSVRSAGVAPSSVNPLAIRAMDEIGVDIRNQRSQHVNEFLQQSFDTVITVCDRAAETCPQFPGHVQRVHWSLPDPAAGQGDEMQRLAAFARVRDELQRRLRAWLADPNDAQATATPPPAASP